MQNEKELLETLETDRWMMGILQLVRDLELPDWWIGAGFVRNKVWDLLHGYVDRTPLNDIDVIYFDPLHTDPGRDRELESRLEHWGPDQRWSVKNQARMHLKHGHEPYRSCEEAISHWVETPTCIAISLTKEGELQLIAPHGLEDLLHLNVRPTPLLGKDKLPLYRQRVKEKGWEQRWPKLSIW